MYIHTYIHTYILSAVISQVRHIVLQEAQLSQRDRAAACLNFGKNISAKSVYLTLLYVTSLTSTNHHFTVLWHHFCTLCKINQHLGVNFEGIWRFELGLLI